MDIKDIKWGSYKLWEGPYYLGKMKFSVEDGQDNEKFLAVITSTEGGCFDSINMYDSCMISSGLIQWCETYYNVSNMLGHLANEDISLISPLNEALKASNADFRKKPDGRWRFFFNDDRDEINNAVKQRSLFFKNSNGFKKSWDEESKDHAKLWLKCVASVWENKLSQKNQIKFTSDRLNIFLTKESKDILFGSNTPKENDGFAGAVRAAYYSFAANLPAVASKQLVIATHMSKFKPWSKEWSINIMKQLTFGPSISIYPGRYNKIRPVIESIYKVDLPDFSKDLENWFSHFNSKPEFMSVKDIQEELIVNGYDLGPKKADGVMGPKTKQAITDFQLHNGLLSDGIVGQKTIRKLIEISHKRNNK